MAGAVFLDRSPPVSPAVSALSATSEASFKSVRGAQIGRGRAAKLAVGSRSSAPLVRSWFSKVVSVSVPNTAADDDDTSGPLEQFLVVAFAVASSHSEGSLWQQKLYWCVLALAATSLLCVCLVPPGANRKPGGVAAVVGWLPRQVCDFFMLRWPSIIATSLAYRGLVLLAFPMTLGYLLSLVFSCYRFTMYLVYVITYLSFSFPLSTLLLLPVAVIVGPKYLKWILLLLGWSILIYVALSGLIAMYTINNVTQVRVPAVLAWRLDHFGRRSRRRASSSSRHHRARKRPAPRPVAEITTPGRKKVASLKSEVEPIILEKRLEGDSRDRISSLISQPTVASVGRTGSGSSLGDDR
ncbi:hypothetical protein FOZ62_017781 [Perkinsus olseni]|nr:hypothetical protein FOZ62_017781 [Perkinsus olseni]